MLHCAECQEIVLKKDLVILDCTHSILHKKC